MNERQAKSWGKVRKLKLYGFLAMWVFAILLGLFIVYLISGYRPQMFITFLTWLIIGIPLQIWRWNDNEKKYKAYLQYKSEK